MRISLQKNRALLRAFTLIEIIMAVVIMAILIVAVIPQIRVIQAGWDAARENAEIIENGQALMDHITFNLMKARRIMAISDSNNPNGFIEFMDDNGVVMRYQIGDNNYVQFGSVGNLSDLAGPVSVLQFACYDTYDLNTPISDVDYVRSIEVQATLPNPGENSRDYALTSWIYLRTNYLSEEMIVGAEYIFDQFYCRSPVLAKVDDEHFLCAYEKPPNIWADGRGYAVILMPKYISESWQITKGSFFQFEPTLGQVPELCQIDATHYLCAYRGPGVDGWAVVLNVNTTTWSVSKYTNFEFADATGLPLVDSGGPDIDPAYRPSLAKIDNTHYLCTYMGKDFDGWAVVLIVDSSTYAISAGTPFEFDVSEGRGPVVVHIKNDQYLCAYSGPAGNGRAIVLTVDTNTWTITQESQFMFENGIAERPDLVKIDDEHFLCAYGGPDNDGWVVVLNVDGANWQITKNTAYEFDPVRGEVPKLQKIDILNYVCSYEGDAGREEDFDLPSSILLYVNQLNWTVCKKMPVKMYGSEEGDTPDIAVIDDKTFFSTYDGYPWVGNATVLEVDLAIKP